MTRNCLACSFLSLTIKFIFGNDILQLTEETICLKLSELCHADQSMITWEVHYAKLLSLADSLGKRTIFYGIKMLEDVFVNCMLHLSDCWISLY